MNQSLNVRLLISTIFSALTAAFFVGCGETGPSVSNNEGNNLERVYILYTGSAGTADFAYYDVAANTVSDEVYKNSNNGKTLNINAGDMKLNNNRDLFITASGQFLTGQGSIYKINTADNTISDSLRVNWNPYGFVINNNNIIVTNLGGSTVSKFDLDFNLITDSIAVGISPSTITYGMAQYVVSKTVNTSERSLSFVSEATNNVIKLFFQSPPVSTVFNVNGFYVSASTSKKIYRINSETIEKVDSFTVPTSQPSISELIFRSQTQFFVIASFREIWKAEQTISGVTFTQLFPSRPDVTILNAAYESTKNEIYIAHSPDQFTNGSMIIIDAENGLVKRTYQLGGKSPVRFVFMY